MAHPPPLQRGRSQSFRLRRSRAPVAPVSVGSRTVAGPRRFPRHARSAPVLRPRSRDVDEVGLQRANLPHPGRPRLDTAGRSDRPSERRYNTGLSARGPRGAGSGCLKGLAPSVVLNTSWISPLRMASTMFGRPSSTLLTRVAGTPAASSAAAYLRCDHLEPEGDEPAHGIDDAGLVVLAHRDEHRAAGRHAGTGAELRLGEGNGEIVPYAHHLAGRAQFRPSTVSTSGKRANGNTASLTAMCPSGRSFREKLARHSHPP